MTCPWCHTDSDDADPQTLCRTHLAEYEGLSLAELERMESEQQAEIDDLGMSYVF